MSGEYTAQLAGELEKELPAEYNIYCSHGGVKNTVYIQTCFYENVSQANRLSYVDILITSEANDGGEKPLVLIEFEETSDSPKIVISDVFSLLFAKYIHLKDQVKPFRLDKTEAIIVSIFIKPNANAEIGRKRLEDIANAINELNPSETKRARVLGDISLSELMRRTKEKVFEHIDGARDMP